MRATSRPVPSARPSTTRSRRCPACCRWPTAPRRRSPSRCRPAFEERLLDAYARDQADLAAAPAPLADARAALARGRRRRPAAAAAAIALAVIGEEEEPSRRYDVSFQNVSGPQTAARRQPRERRRGHRDPPLGPTACRRREAVYEVLCDAEEWTATAGTFRTDAQGRAYVILTTALRQGEYNAIRIVRRGHRTDGRLYKRNVLTARLS